METTATSVRPTAVELGRQIIFNTEKLGEFAVITQPMSKVKLRVLNNVSEKNLIVRDDGRAAYIVTLAAIAVDKHKEAIERFKGKREVPIEETNGLFMTVNIWVNTGDRPALPMRGELINCSIDWVEGRLPAGSAPGTPKPRVLRVVGYSLDPAQILVPKFNLNDIGIATDVKEHTAQENQTGQTSNAATTIADNEIVH